MRSLRSFRPARSVWPIPDLRRFTSERRECLNIRLEGKSLKSYRSREKSRPLRDAGCLVDQVKLFARLEPYGLPGSDADLGARSWVTSNPCFPGLDRKDPETAQLDPFARDQRPLHAIEDCIDRRLCFCPGKPSALNHSLNEILLNQEYLSFGPNERRMSSFLDRVLHAMLETATAIVNVIRLP